MTTQIEFSPEEKKALDYERYYHPHPQVQKRMEILWLKSQELPHQQIAQLASVSKGTVTKYVKMYKEGGIEQLKKINFHRPKSKLCEYTGTLREHFEKNPVASLKEAAHQIEKLTGIRRSETQVRKYLLSIGIKCRKVGMIPAKADPEVQQKFKDEKLDPVLEEAKEGNRHVYFVDAAHFVLAPFLGFLWSFTRIFIQAPAGRKRFNVLGALDAITHELIMVTNDSYINAQSVCDLLDKLRKLHPGIPITLILDNARYQKCKIVWEKAKEHQIDLLYLPPYSPNLNIIERLWKFVKKECLYSKYYETFGAFKSAIADCLEHTHNTYKDELDSLLTLNFQMFSDVEKAHTMTS